MKMSLRFWHRWLHNRRTHRRSGVAAKRRLGMQMLEDRRVPATLFGLTENNQLIRFDSSNPGAAIQITVTGLGATEKLTSIDFRPSNEKLYAISDTNSDLYTINTSTGAATLIGAAGFVPVAMRFGIDVDPMTDQIRFVSDSGNNIRINPDSGAVASFDSGINGATNSLDEIAYTNNFAGTTSTSLFGINSTTDSLYQIIDPNSGLTVLQGPLGVDTDNRIGFDVSFDDGNAYASLTVGGVAELYTINLTTGAAVPIGTIGMGTPLIGLSAQTLTNVPPVVHFSGSTPTYDTDSDVPVQIDPNATIFDPNSTDFNGGSLTIMGASSHPNDLLTIRGGGNVTISGNKVFFNGTQVGTFTAGDGFLVPFVVNFNASSSPAAAQAILRQVVFSTTDDPSTGPRHFQATVTDGAGGSDTSNTQDVNLADLTPPRVVSITRNDPDPTNATILNYTVTFSENVTGVDVTDFVITSTGTIAGTSVNSVTPIDGKTYTVQVGDMTGEGTVRLDVTDDDTIIDVAGNKLGGDGTGNGDFTTGQVYTIDRTPPIVIIAQAQTQTDPGFSQPVHFFVSFSEVVTGFDQSDVMVSGTAGANMVTVTLIKAGGTDYDVAVSGATMDGTVIINIAAGAATDAAGNPNDPATIFDNKVTVDLDAPTITAPTGTLNGTENAKFTFDMSNPVSVHDDDLNGGKMSITLAATDGTLTLSTISGLTFTTGTGTNDMTVTFTGTEADIDAALTNLVFTPTNNFSGMTSVTISAPDDTTDPNAAVGNSTVTLNIAKLNQPPVITINNTTGGDIITPEDTKVTFQMGLITIADPDAGTDAVQVTLSVTNGTLSFADFSKLTFTTGDGTADAKMVFTGTLTDINAALNGLSYLGNQDFNGMDTVTIGVDDLGHNGAGGNMTDSKTVPLTITAVNDAPVNHVPGTQTVDENGTLAFTGTNAISITDVDVGTGMEKVTLSSPNGILTLSGITGLTFTTGANGSASMTFTGTLTDINAALTGLTFAPTHNFSGPTTITILTDDQGNTGSGGNMTATDTVNITVNHVNQAPVGVNDSFTTKQNQALHIAAPGVLANDTDPDTGTTLTAVLITDVPATAGRLTLAGNGGFDFTPATNFVGTTTFQYKASDGQLLSNLVTVTITVTANLTHLFAVGAGPGGQPQVVVHNADGSVRFSFLAFDAAFTGGVTVATGDVNGDGIDDIICGAGPSGGPNVRVFDGANSRMIQNFMAYDPKFTGGVNVAAGDVNGDGFADIITGAGPGGGPHVAVFDGRNDSIIQSFMAYDPAFTGGVSVAAGDYNGDGKADIVTGAGPGGGPHVIVYAGTSLQILQSFYAFDPAFTGGVNVAAGEFNSQPAIFAAAGPGGLPVVSVFNASSAQQVASIFAYEQTDTTGVHIGSDTGADGKTTLYLAPGPDHAPAIRVLDANTLGDKNNFNAFDPAFLGGVFIG